MAMKAVVVCGSRNPRGQTGRAAEVVVEGLRSGGAEVSVVYLPERAIERCRQCDDDGWGLCRREGTCVIEDDFASIVATIRTADAVVFATPVYFSDLAESLRAFLDRVRRTSRFVDGAAGITGKPAVGVCVAGGGGGGAPSCCAILTGILQTCGFDVVDMLPVRRQNLEAKLAQLRLAGRWLVVQTVGP